MCATVVWAINHAAYTPAFERFTETQIGVAPQPTEHLIVSSRVRRSAVSFTLTRNMCDCSSLIGSRSAAPSPSETDAASWLDWLRLLPEHTPFLTRLALLRAWSPAETALIPSHAAGLHRDAVDERVLRGIGDNSLLTIDFR